MDPDDVFKTEPVDPDNVIVKKEVEADERILDLDDKEALRLDNSIESKIIFNISCCQQ